ncbi:hypothetical protein KSP40_PGU020878 [Platanthera guangdongensis]|uniref:Uncharacterized protein n=1 Tax=Platanthera guangdongensis TaxID=2320717 RepID=A0ABR2LWU2_9ASPA
MIEQLKCTCIREKRCVEDSIVIEEMSVKLKKSCLVMIEQLKDMLGFVLVSPNLDIDCKDTKFEGDKCGNEVITPRLPSPHTECENQLRHDFVGATIWEWGTAIVREVAPSRISCRRNANSPRERIVKFPRFGVVKNFHDFKSRVAIHGGKTLLLCLPHDPSASAISRRKNPPPILCRASLRRLLMASSRPGVARRKLGPDIPVATKEGEVVAEIQIIDWKNRTGSILGTLLAAVDDQVSSKT